MATSADQDYPASNILDPNEKAFWMTTGMYPQEFIVSFRNPLEFRHVRFVTSNVKSFIMFATSNQEPRNFESILEKTLPNTENNLQTTDQMLDRSVEARHFKCVITAGYDSFASVHDLIYYFAAAAAIFL